MVQSTKMRAIAAAQRERPENRFRRMTYGTAASLLRQGVAVVSQLVMVPLLLAPWGTQRYGEWLGLSATVAYLTILDFGVQTYATNRLTRCRATGDWGQYTRVLHSAWALNLTLAGTAIVIVIPVLATVPLQRWLQLRMTD